MENQKQEKSLIEDLKTIIDQGRGNAYSAANKAMIVTYWALGKRIAEEIKGNDNADLYGKSLIPELAKELTREFGRAFSARNLYYYVKFYQYFPDFEILNARVQNLSWTHLRSLLRVDDESARLWYLNEAAKENWSSRTLDRNIATQYYYRLLESPDKEKVVTEMKLKTAQPENRPAELLKSPIMAEFLGFRPEDSYLESDLESAILSHIRDFLMEMGRGFAFVARQQQIVTETEDYYIDLVFYNIELRCYVLVDLKMGKITHQDVGQIDMYVRMYDDMKRKNGDNPTIGILVCSETDEDIARYSVLHDNNRLFMSKYLTYLPTKEQLRREIEKQKRVYYLQHEQDDSKED
ncbi:MAG: PDDEXK nuclease domain-containing protein [Lactimicrobium sp.]|jgi:predicted nuclease of restriction endonuclease-like (RecB) superfamily|uniref:PDDEXK nuclease domain-containing protein n=1 Tax=Lactimicrobium sp. TaxID=2563780 RepID=UPI002F356135